MESYHVHHTIHLMIPIDSLVSDGGSPVHDFAETAGEASPNLPWKLLRNEMSGICTGLGEPFLRNLPRASNKCRCISIPDSTMDEPHTPHILLGRP